MKQIKIYTLKLLEPKKVQTASQLTFLLRHSMFRTTAEVVG
jgi:hypothetical protein